MTQQDQVTTEETINVPVTIRTVSPVVGGNGNALAAMTPHLEPIRLDNLTRYSLVTSSNPTPYCQDQHSWCTFPGMVFNTKKYMALYGQQYVVGCFFRGRLDGSLKIGIHAPNGGADYPAYFATSLHAGNGVGFKMMFDPVRDKNWHGLWLLDFTVHESKPCATLEMVVHKKKSKNKNDNSNTGTQADNERQGNPIRDPGPDFDFVRS